MSDFLTTSAYFGMVLTFLAYGIGIFCKNKFRSPLANPVVIGSVIVGVVLVVLNLDYQGYADSVTYISYFLTPATVCLAIPLYRQIRFLKQYPLAILGGVLSGVLTAMVSIYGIARIFDLNHAQYVTLLPKSVTTAIGIGVSENMGGIVTLTVVAISITGITGTLSAELVLRLFRITNPVAKGIAIGSASHALGTTKAMEMGEVEGAMSSLSIVLTGIITVIFVSIFANFI